MVNVGEVCRPRHGGPVLRKPTFDWKATDKCIELLHFEMEVMILQTGPYELNNEEKVSIIKKTG